MKKILLYLLICLSVKSFSQSKSILFVGNSYTGVNNLPQLTAQLATSAGFTLNYSAQTPGGAQLNQHISNTSVIAAIYSQSWDFVVLQEQSQKPSFGHSSVSANVYPYATRLCDTIRMNDSCTQPIFYMTWGRKFGDVSNCSTAPWLCTYKGMDSALAVSYNTMGQQNDAFVSPVGAVWNYIIKNHPTINLYSSDNSHPSMAGTYAAACTFFSVIFRENPLLISNNSTLSATDAAIIRNAAKIVCYDSLSKWNVGDFDPASSFTATVFGNSVQIINSSVKADSYSWKFGDSSLSSLPNPSKTYALSGNYTIQLIASKCGVTDTSYQTVTIANPTDIDENSVSELKIYPNPSNNGIFYIEGSSSHRNVVIYSIYGELIKNNSISSKNSKLDLSDLAQGVYIIKIGNEKAKKIVISN